MMVTAVILDKILVANPLKVFVHYFNCL